MTAQRESARDRGYDRRWERTRRAYLRAHPLCECEHCLTLPDDMRPAATDIDHIDGLGPSGPRGHDRTNLRAMSHSHHSRRTAQDQPAGWHATPPRQRQTQPHPGLLGGGGVPPTSKGQDRRG